MRCIIRHHRYPASSFRMTVVLGVDGCPDDGWVAAEVRDGRQVRWHHVTGATALLALADELGADAVAVDVPIGLPEQGLRRCDVQARARLGGRASAVFAAPVRGALAYRTYAEARPHLPAMSAQTFALVARIRDIDAGLRSAGRVVHDRVVECHPEVCFQALTGGPLPRKKSAPGALLRLAALRGLFREIPLDAPVGAALDDALDALVCAWTAGRWLRGDAEVLGGGLDATGIPMRIVL